MQSQNTRFIRVWNVLAHCRAPRPWKVFQLAVFRVEGNFNILSAYSNLMKPSFKIMFGEKRASPTPTNISSARGKRRLAPLSEAHTCFIIRNRALAALIHHKKQQSPQGRFAAPDFSLAEEVNNIFCHRSQFCRDSFYGGQRGVMAVSSIPIAWSTARLGGIPAGRFSLTNLLFFQNSFSKRSSTLFSSVSFLGAATKRAFPITWNSWKSWRLCFNRGRKRLTWRLVALTGP